MPTFFRGNYSQLWITLRSDEVLGILDADYIEDFDGNDGQVTVIGPDGPFTVLMAEVLETTPSIPHDTFTGVVELNDVPNGHYVVQGRVRDTLGNYTIIGAVANPIGTERVISLEFDIALGFGVVVSFGTLTLRAGIGFTVEMPDTHFEDNPAAIIATGFVPPVNFITSLSSEFNV